MAVSREAFLPAFSSRNEAKDSYIVRIAEVGADVLDAKDRAHLDEVAGLMIREAQAIGSDRIFSATGFARENISIVHQQLRCANLAWALGHTKRIKRGDVVAIVGGSFSGLMLAASLAIADDAIIYIFEKEKRLLHRFLDKSQRHLSPNLNSRYLGKRFHPDGSSPFFMPPIFQWSRGVASDVASQWLREFEGYQRKLPIFSFLGWEVTKQHIKSRKAGLTIDLRGRDAPHIQPIEVDLLIDATGFGEEGNPHGLTDFSYWESGHRLIYDHLPKTSDVLVSGCGDSGLVEAMHYAICDFRHELVEKLWPSRANLEAHLDLGLQGAKLDGVLKSAEVERYGGRVISEVCWWLDTWFRLQHWKRDWSLRSEGGHAAPIFCAIEEVLQPHLKATFPGRNLSRLRSDDREAFAVRLPLKVQLEAREAVRPIADAWISRGIARLASKLAVGKLLRIRKLHAMARSGVTVTLNGATPTPYTRQLSTYNVWLMRVVTSFPNVIYREGLISKVEGHGPAQFRVTFDNGSTQIFDRVVTRYGVTAVKKGWPLAKRWSRDPHDGSWLLTPVSYQVPTSEPHVSKIIEPAIERVAGKLKKVERRRGSGRSKPLDKTYYAWCLLTKPKITQTDEVYRDPRAWLSATLRAGVRPRYVESG